MRPPTEAALLLLFGVKGGLLRLHPLYQLFDPIKRSLIGDPGGQLLVMLDFTVDLGAFITHGSSALREGGCPTL
jgi:hypothetical protein